VLCPKAEIGWAINPKPVPYCSMLTWGDIQDWSSSPIRNEASSWNRQYSSDREFANDLKQKKDSIQSTGNAADAARKALLAQYIAANEQLNYSTGMQLAFSAFASGIDAVSGLVCDAYNVAQENWCDIGSDGRVWPSYDIPIPTTTLSPEEYAQARAALVIRCVIAAANAANQYDQNFADALRHLSVGTSTIDPSTGRPADGSGSTLGADVAADDPLTPGENSQHILDDCWLISTINAMMETTDGQQQLRDGIQWIDHPAGYRVRIYDNGKEIWVTVTETLPGGATIFAGASSGPGIVSLYEAAIAKYFGPNYMQQSHMPGTGVSIMTNQKTNISAGIGYGPGNNNIVPREAMMSGGSVDGTLSLAGTPPRWLNVGSMSAQATPDPASAAATQKILIVPNHTYEVVDIKNGMIGLRNPWGVGNPYDGSASNAAGVFYISQQDFAKAFGALTIPEG